MSDWNASADRLAALRERLLRPRAASSVLAQPLDAQAMLGGLVRAEVTGAACGASGVGLQSYTITLHVDHGAIIHAATPAGVRHALADLVERARAGQLLQGTLGGVPAFAKRGVLLDVSRTRVPTMQHMVEVLDELAVLRCNHLQLYVEHTFAYAGHEAAWVGHGAITPQELSRIDELARARGIELAANQNCFGHLRHWLELPAYRDLAETHGDWMFDIWPRSGPFSLCPGDARSLALVSDWITQQASCVRGGMFNINCDEVYDIAFGRSAVEVAARGRVAVFCEFVSKVMGQVRWAGKRPMFWGDVVLTHDATPEHQERLASLREHDPIALVWGYEADTPFDAWIQRVRGAGIEAWVCPGTSCWRSIAGRASDRRGNVVSAICSGLAHGATGLLLCEWGDCGHWQTWPVTRHALREGLHGAWEGRLDARPLPEDVRRCGAWLDGLGDADALLREVAGELSKPGLTRLRNQGALFASLAHGRDVLARAGTLEVWRAARDRVATLAGDVPGEAGRSSLEHEELSHTGAMLAWCADRAVALLEGDSNALAEIASRRDAMERAHRRLWLARARAGGLEASCEHFRAVGHDVAAPKVAG